MKRQRRVTRRCLMTPSFDYVALRSGRAPRPRLSGVRHLFLRAARLSRPQYATTGLPRPERDKETDGQKFPFGYFALTPPLLLTLKRGKGLRRINLLVHSKWPALAATQAPRLDALLGRAGEAPRSWNRVRSRSVR